MVSALLIHNTAVKLKTKKNKKEKKTATTYGETECSACRKIDTQYKLFAFLPPFLPFIHLFSSTLNWSRSKMSTTRKVCSISH